MTGTFNSPWLGALASGLTQPGGPAERGGAADPAAAWPPMPGDQYDDIDALPFLVEEEPEPPDAEAQAARDRSVYRIGFALLIGAALAVGLSTAMLLRS